MPPLTIDMRDSGSSTPSVSAPSPCVYRVPAFHLADLAYHTYAAGAWDKSLAYPGRAGQRAWRYTGRGSRRTQSQPFSPARTAAGRLRAPLAQDLRDALADGAQRACRILEFATSWESMSHQITVHR